MVNLFDLTPLGVITNYNLKVIQIGEKYFASADEEGLIEEITRETAEALIEAGTPLFNTLASGLVDIGDDIREGLESLGEGIIDVGEGIGSATLDVLENAGVALIKAAGKTKKYIVDEIGDRRVTFVKQFTMIIIVLMTTVFIYNSLMLKDR